MKTTFKARILISFITVIAVLGSSMGVLGFYIIRRDILEKTRAEVRQGLASARMEYGSKIAKIRNTIDLVSPGDDLGLIAKKGRLDYLYYVPASERDMATSEIVLKAFQGQRLGGTRVMGPEEIKAIGPDFYENIRMEVKPTPKAAPSDRKDLDSALAIEYAMPVKGELWGEDGVLYGGRIINKDYLFVDKIRDLVFGDRIYDSKPVGTVTIFQDDVRVATNVLDDSGERAIGTRISQKVYDAVAVGGRTWKDKAFVVTDWYLTAYEPIRNVNGRTVGILYVGILEKPFLDLSRDILLVFSGIIAVGMAVAVFFSFVLASLITRHMKEMVSAADKVASGELETRVAARTSIIELDRMAASFNNMAQNLNESHRMLKIWNEKLTDLNKDYLDLIGFVSHELKSILASTILNAYSVRDGFLGMVNFKQRKALDSITRNLDYLAVTVKNFLNLSRIEKGEITLNVTDLSLKEDVFNASVESLKRAAEDKNMEILNNVGPGIKVAGDPDQLEIAANNLVGNAIKYGLAGGKVVISSRDIGDEIEIDVYNDGTPLSGEDISKLFRKFSRLTTSGGRKVRGTGLGLFITKEVIEKHGGTIRVEAREKGNSFVFTVKKKL